MIYFLLVIYFAISGLTEGYVRQVRVGYRTYHIPRLFESITVFIIAAIGAGTVLIIAAGFIGWGIYEIANNMSRTRGKMLIRKRWFSIVLPYWFPVALIISGAIIYLIYR